MSEHRISACQSRVLDRSFYLHITYEIKALASCDRPCKFVKVDSGQIRVSHCLANFARIEYIAATRLGSDPRAVIKVFFA
jgi:hypothetical protein